jgi:hypothetical protein
MSNTPDAHFALCTSMLCTPKLCERTLCMSSKKKKSANFVELSKEN